LFDKQNFRAIEHHVRNVRMPVNVC